MEPSIIHDYIAKIISSGHDMISIRYRKTPPLGLRSLTYKEISEVLAYRQDVVDPKKFLSYELSRRVVTFRGLKVSRSSGEDLLESFAKLPILLLTELVDKARNADRRVLWSIPYLVSFIRTPVSQSMWESSKLMRNLNTDNPLIAQWVQLCSLLDKEEALKNDQDLALLVASASNPKGVRDLRNKLNARETDKQEHIDLLLKYGARELIPSASARKHKLVTRQDLLDEISKIARGEKDEHDLFIEKHFEDVRKAAVTARQKAEERSRKLAENQPTYFDSLPASGMLVLTEDQLAEYEKREGLGPSKRFLQ